MKVQHHIKYKEIHGYDEIVMMERSEHKKLNHRELFSGCTVEKLAKISSAANKRSNYYKKHSKEHRKTTQYKDNKREYDKNNIKRIEFYSTPGKNTRIHEMIVYNNKTGTVTYSTSFKPAMGYILPIIDIEG